MKKILIIAAVAAACLCIISCNNNTEQNKTAQTNAETTTTDIMEVDQLLADADSLVGREVTFQGVCTHTCKHGARKIFIMGSDDTQVIRVEAGDLGAFSQDCVNNIACKIGRLRPKPKRPSNMATLRPDAILKRVPAAKQVTR